MAPVKFEEDIKEKLEKRTMQPSNDAWNKLSERLEGQGKSKNKKPVLWLGIAASIVGILLVTSQFFSNETTVVNEVPKIVVVPETVEQNKDTTIEVETDVATENTSGSIQTNQKRVVKKSIKTPVEVKTELDKKQTVIVQENDLEVLKKISVNSVEVALKPLTFEEEKIQAVANQIQKLKDNNTVTDEAIDALLLEAQKEIRLNKLYNTTTTVVDANLLLQDVEADLDQSFRSKVFEAIKASYGTVKTAVAQRND
ncbi:hypothetical protein Q4Q35_20950 [Flavivirga aquimarina]|uniref:Anti-sigma factor n=1 Tax=Flavivirga aquimarina TaxID=2027862 RepID=A0ABT8WGM2_9FLAO|nr:hypothetical protein [Flavivirga aquimarina]MDO5972275.1 hypothetical protein [Flavivirga aquimarina]